MSIIHLAVAPSEAGAIGQHLAARVLFDLLAGEGLAPLHWALAFKAAVMQRLLLQPGSSVGALSAEGVTPLVNDSRDGSIEQMRTLLGHGSDVSDRDRRGFAGLHGACEMGKLAVARLLLHHGASPNPEAEGHTPRSLAGGRRYREIVAALDKQIEDVRIRVARNARSCTLLLSRSGRKFQLETPASIGGLPTQGLGESLSRR
jgi:ankyrin repeat protein